MAIALGGLGSSLTHRNVAVRATSAWLIGLVALVGAWLVSYRWMPEGVVGFSLAAQLPLESLRQQASLTAGIFLWNLAVGGIRALRHRARDQLLRHHDAWHARRAADRHRVDARRAARAVGLPACRGRARRPAPLVPAQRLGLAALARPLLAGPTPLARGGRAAARRAPAADVERRHRGRPDRRGARLARSRC